MTAARRSMPLAGSLFVALCSGLWAIAADAAPRTWTDSSGKHKMKASFVSLDDGKVTLEKNDGETIEIDLKKLSKADQKYIADATKAGDDSPFKSKKSDSPFNPTYSSPGGFWLSAPRGGPPRGRVRSRAHTAPLPPVACLLVPKASPVDRGLIPAVPRTETHVAVAASMHRIAARAAEEIVQEASSGSCRR